MTTEMMVFGGVGVAVIAVTLLLSFVWRVVVPTNLVHIVQSSRKTTSYGAGGAAGNTYYNIPSFIPIFGVTRIVLPVNNFSINLEGYEAYDRDRAPFELDVVGFFLIGDTNLAAARASSFTELSAQLKSIMQGAARTILARHDINEIMGDRATFGDAFTKEVDEGLKAWGVQTVKSLELMDIRDAKGSKIIADIMAKKSSQIEMESRKVVAENARQAQIAEIEARQSVDLREQEQQQMVGQRTAEQEREVGIAKQRAQQDVQAQAKVTKDREMDVIQVQAVRGAEIARQTAVVKADEQKQAKIIAAEAERQERIVKAEGEKQHTVLVADGNKEAALLNAQGIKAEGEAKGAAEQALLLAPVNAQITLAEKIAALPAYQTYLVSIREVEARERVGVENAKALAVADIKVIATSGDASSGIASLSDVLSAKGGVQMGAMLQGLANTETGAAVLERFGMSPDSPVAYKPNGKPA
jgi:flotillin